MEAHRPFHFLRKASLSTRFFSQTRDKRAYKTLPRVPGLQPIGESRPAWPIKSLDAMKELRVEINLPTEGDNAPLAFVAMKTEGLQRHFLHKTHQVGLHIRRNHICRYRKPSEKEGRLLLKQIYMRVGAAPSTARPSRGTQPSLAKAELRGLVVSRDDCSIWRARLLEASLDRFRAWRSSLVERYPTLYLVSNSNRRRQGCRRTIHRARPAACKFMQCAESQPTSRQGGVDWQRVGSTGSAPNPSPMSAWR